MGEIKAFDIEKLEIEERLMEYFTHYDNLDGDSLIKILHPQAALFTVRNGNIVRTSREDFGSGLTKTRENPNSSLVKEKSRKNILSINLTGNSASVMVEYIFSSFKSTDHYHMLKENGVWYIVNKMYYMEKI